MNQIYEAEIIKEYVIKGNPAIVRCSIPSFVADFVYVDGWIDENGIELRNITSGRDFKKISVLDPLIHSFIFLSADLIYSVLSFSCFSVLYYQS